MVRIMQSTVLTLEAAILTSNSPDLAAGLSMSTISKDASGPYFLMTMAFMLLNAFAEVNKKSRLKSLWLNIWFQLDCG